MPARKPHDLTFEILWLDDELRVVGLEYVERHDLTDALTAASNKLQRHLEPRRARGFVVRRLVRVVDSQTEKGGEA